MMNTQGLALVMLAAIGAVAARPVASPVTSLSVVSRTGRADVVVGVEGPVTLEHFTLPDPDRIVVDLSDATLGLPDGDPYDGVSRGGITRIRYSQFTRTVVRIVITLDAAHGYTVTNDQGALRISIDGPANEFQSWAVGKGTIVSHEAAITWSWENAPISDVLAMFASYSRRTILPSKNVSGIITANIIDQPWDVALRAVMNANGYDIVVDDRGIIIVDTFEAIAARQSMVPLQTRTVRLNYSHALSVQQMVAARLTRTCPLTPQAAAAQVATGSQTASQPVGIQSIACPTRGIVTADTITNAVSITDVPSALADLEAYARSLDLRQPQVNIKAKIILVDRSTLEGLGLRYDVGTPQQFFNDMVPRVDPTGKPRTDAGQIAFGGNALSAIANASARVPGTALQLVYSTAMGGYDFTTFLEALQTNAMLDVQAEPSTTVLNNRTANLTAGTQVPIRVIDAGSAAGNTSNAPRAQVNMQQTGIILTVTPQITANRQVQMKIHVENSDVQFQANDVGAVFPTQKVDNEVLVADGETAVMGGLTQTSVSASRSGLPVLGDLPVIGRFFGVTNRVATKRYLLILITPHIVDDGQRPNN